MKFLISLVLIGVLLLVLMPIWPDGLKSIILYFLFGLIYLILFFIIIRYTLYFLIRVLGYNFWILPNIKENVKIF